EAKVVVSALPFQRICEAGVKPVPVTVTVSAAEPVAAWAGTMPVIVNGASKTVTLIEPDKSPPSLAAVTPTVPARAVSLVPSAISSNEALSYVVGSGLPFQYTVTPGEKNLPPTDAVVDPVATAPLKALPPTEMRTGV